MTCTEWAAAYDAVTVPEATSVLKVSVVDTCQSTGTSALAIPPWPSALSGLGARRVHSTTLIASGSPQAMPSWNGYGTAAVAVITEVWAVAGRMAGRVAGRAPAPAAASPPKTRVLRLIGLMGLTFTGTQGGRPPDRPN